MRRNDGPGPVWEIVPGQLYQRGKMHDWTEDRKKGFLGHYGITMAVALAPPTPDPDLGDCCRYVHEPIPDGLLRRPELVVALAKQAAEEIEDGGAVVTMCNAGRNRSGLLSALTLYELGMPAGDLIDFVRKHRPRALANDHFVAYLEELL